jgi:superoxide reductase
MTNYGDFYHCEICGQVVTIAQEGSTSLTCCGQPMNLLEPKTSGAGEEKHIPVIVPNGDSTLIKVGEVPHVMTSEHFISFVEVVTKDGKIGRAQLSDVPEVVFNIKAEEIITVYEYCNLHGLWMTKQ